MGSTATSRLEQKGIVLPPPPRPVGMYSAVVLEKDRAWVSGQIATQNGVVLSPGLVDRDVSPERARELAGQAALQALSALTASLGSLDRVQRVLRLVVYVASSPGFFRQHEVANGASEILLEAFGEAGRPARAAVGASALPLNAPVELELVVAFD